MRSLALTFVIYVILQRIHGLSRTNHVNFNFDDEPPNPDLADGVQTRQGPIPGSIPGNLNPFPPPGGFPPLSSITPFIVTPNVTTCYCVPIGSCPTGAPTDGTGQIDIRIVTNPGGVNPIPPPTIAPCGNGLVACCTTGGYQCGRRYPPVAGAPSPGAGQAPYGAYPWQAALLSNTNVYLGSGALYDNRHVITAAHKVAALVNGGFLKVRLGEWNAGTENEPFRAQEFIVARIFIHPEYNSGNLKNNIAVLRLGTPVALGTVPTIGTVCLPTGTFIGSRCWVSGWGRNDFTNGAYQAIQKHVDVPILTPADCQSRLSGTRLGPSFVYDANSFICAGGENGKDACTGDGGAPLVCELNGIFNVVGLVAWGIGCGQANIPGVYVNVLNYVGWIRTTVAST